MLLGLCGPWTTRTLAQHTVHVEGIVKDSVTGEALPAVAVMLKGTTIGTVTDNDGRFTLEAESAARTLSVSYLGYETYERPLTGTNRLTIRLQPTTYTLNDVVVRPGHERYSRHNQAVDFVRNVIERRELNAPRNHDYFSFSTYDRKIFAKNDFEEAEERGKKRYRRIDFIFDYIDTSHVSGKPILPLYNEEVIEQTYFRRTPRTERRLVQGVKRAGLVEIFSEDGITQFVNEVFREPDVFQDNIPLFLQRFVSPLASFGPTFYKYYLTNTVEITDALNQRLDALLQDDLPPDVEKATITDQSSYVRENVADVWNTIFFGGFLALAITYLFLRDIRATLIGGLAIPTSVVAAFFLMKSMGFTLNNMSLMGLSLAVGFLIDDAIVLVENIFRHMEMGKTPALASEDATIVAKAACMLLSSFSSSSLVCSLLLLSLRNWNWRMLSAPTVPSV